MKMLSIEHKIPFYPYHQYTGKLIVPNFSQPFNQFLEIYINKCQIKFLWFSDSWNWGHGVDINPPSLVSDCSLNNNQQQKQLA